MPITVTDMAEPHLPVRRWTMSISAIVSSAQAASFNSVSAIAIVSQITTTNPGGATVTITTTYANGTTSTVTQAAPPSIVTTREVSNTNADGTITITTFYSDGRTATTTQTSPNPPVASNVLDPNNPVQRSVLVWA
jgi:hypothetical protein